MEINVTINGVKKTWRCQPGDTLLRVLRREGYYSVRFGSDTGETGASAVLLDGQLVSTEVMLAAQADGHAGFLFLHPAHSTRAGPAAPL